MGEDELWKKVEKWKELSQRPALFQNLAAVMPARPQAVIDAGGTATKCRDKCYQELPTNPSGVYCLHSVRPGSTFWA